MFGNFYEIEPFMEPLSEYYESKLHVRNTPAY